MDYNFTVLVQIYSYLPFYS